MVVLMAMKVAGMSNGVAGQVSIRAHLEGHVIMSNNVKIGKADLLLYYC